MSERTFSKTSTKTEKLGENSGDVNLFVRDSHSSSNSPESQKTIKELVK